MEIVRSRLGHEDLNTATETTVLGIVNAGQQLELAEHLRRREVEHHAARFGNNETSAIDLDFGGAAAGTGNRQFRNTTAIDARHVTDECLRIPDASRKQWQVLHKLRREGLATLWRGGFEQRRVGRYLDRLQHVADLQPQVQVLARDRANLNAGPSQPAETGFLDADVIRTNRQTRKHIEPSFGGPGFGANPGPLVRCNHRRIRHRGAVWIGDYTTERPRGRLREA